MDMDKQTYRRYADARAPRSSSPRNCLRAFWVGGTVCLVGQSLCDLYTGICSMSREDGGTLASITLVLISAVLTGLGVFDRIAKYAGAGTLVPITGFANAVASPAIDARSEGRRQDIHGRRSGSSVRNAGGRVLRRDILDHRTVHRIIARGRKLP